MTTQFNVSVSDGCDHQPDANPETNDLRTLHLVSDWQAPEGGIEPEQRLRIRRVRVRCSNCGVRYKTMAYDLATASELPIP